MDILVNLTSATICFLNTCYPALVGKDTPVGSYQIVTRLTEQDGYGGDVLQFAETEEHVLAIHRVWLLDPKEGRMERLESPIVKRRIITKGCINVKPEVYEMLKDCCSKQTLIIQK